MPIDIKIVLIEVEEEVIKINVVGLIIIVEDVEDIQTISVELEC